MMFFTLVLGDRPSGKLTTYKPVGDPVVVVGVDAASAVA
jgi:hypothetical protein